MPGPAIDDAGPGASGIMPALGRRGIMTVLPLLAILTVLSGFGLYWKVAAGAFDAFARTGTGVELGFSAVVAVAAYLIGILITCASMMGAVALLQPMATAPAEQRAQQLASANLLRARGARAGKAGAALLPLAAAGMAMARYL